jgi:NAD(P)H-hydrate epimerase
LESLQVINSKTIFDLIPSRAFQSQTGDNGVVLVVGGNSFYHGAPVLASIAALRSGSDLVYSAVPRSIVNVVRSFSPVLIVLPLGKDSFTSSSASKLFSLIPNHVDAAAIGMGMTLEPQALFKIIGHFGQARTRILLDASALIPEVLDEISGSGSILTPHAGEFKRLFGYLPGNSKEEIVSNVVKLARQYSVTIALKGSVNVVSDGEQTAAIKRSTPAMTVGGTGDVLAGLTAGLLAKNMKPYDAAVAALYINGTAGKTAFKEKGLHIVPTDILDKIPEAFKPFDRVEREH